MHSYLEMNLKKALSLKNPKQKTGHNTRHNQANPEVKSIVRKQINLLVRKQTQPYFKINII